MESVPKKTDNKADELKKKHRLLRWRGVLDESTQTMRVMVAIMLTVAGVALSFTQLGFVAITLPDGETGYAIVLLQIVALASLFLGPITGAIMGVSIGGVLYLHSQVMPLDHYELMYVTPVTSFVMFGLAGLILGLLFAFVLRNNPSQVRRVVYIFIVCIIISLLYTGGFVVNVIVSLLAAIADTYGWDVTTSQAASSAISASLGFGSMSVQAEGTGLLMGALCSVGDYVAGRIREHEGTYGLRVVFGAWLAAVVSLSFFTMAAVSFAVATGDDLNDAEADLFSEANYLQKQFMAFDKQQNLLRQTLSEAGFDYDKVSDETLYELSEIFEARNILNGYTAEDDGIIFISIGDAIYATDDERYKNAGVMSDALSSEALKAIDRCLETGKMQRIVYIPPAAMEAISEENYELPDTAEMQPTIAYLVARDAPGSYITEDNKTKSYDQKVIIIRTSDQVFDNREQLMIWMTLSQLVLMLCVFGIMLQLLNRVVARRIDETNAALSRVTAGELDTRAEAGGTSEFESLSSGINTTVDTLKGWIAEAETRMDAELSTAKTIQESALPRTFPPYPDIEKFDVYAIMNAAREVGGDFYDFFLIGDGNDNDSGKLGFIIADVSGKGVPAALFMMKAKTQIRDYLASGMEPGEAIENVNRLLCDGNDESMFVTVWAGSLDYATGRVEFVNAGHNPPLLWSNDGGWHWLEEKSGLPLGLFDGLPYQTHSVDCQPGDTFLLYTDGVTEAMSVDEELFGEDRLLAVAEESAVLHPRALVEAVRRGVAEHARGAEQSDDITVLALEVGVPPEITATLTVPADVSELPRVNEFIHTELDRRLCPLRAQSQLDIAVEELFVNVCHYAYPDATPENPGTVRVSYTCSADPPSVRVDIADDGIPYDPLAKPDAVTPDDIMDVPIGGLGILMAKRSVDDMTYRREGGSNIVSITKKW